MKINILIIGTFYYDYRNLIMSGRGGGGNSPGNAAEPTTHSSCLSTRKSPGILQPPEVVFFFVAVFLQTPLDNPTFDSCKVTIDCPLRRCRIIHCLPTFSNSVVRNLLVNVQIFILPLHTPRSSEIIGKQEFLTIVHCNF